MLEKRKRGRPPGIPAEMFLDNSQEHLDHLGPTSLSTRKTAARISRGLKSWTGLPWNVTLMLEGQVPGGFYVEPHPSRLHNGAVSTDDWVSLEHLLDVVPRLGACRYYILPDEAERVLHILEVSGPPMRTQKSWKQRR